MRNFTESGLHFKFSADWVVQAYDKSRYYVWLSGTGLKAVDFIVYQNDQLYLIEVKHYGQYQASNSSAAVLPSPEELTATFYQKVQDTLKGIQTVQSYLQRKRLFRITARFLLWLQIHKPLSNSWGFWTHIAELATSSSTQRTYILLLESTNAPTDSYHAVVQTQLEQLSQHPNQRWIVTNAKQWAATVKGVQIKVM